MNKYVVTELSARILRALTALGVATLIVVIEQPQGWAPVLIFAMWFAYGITEMLAIVRYRRKSPS